MTEPWRPIDDPDEMVRVERTLTQLGNNLGSYWHRATFFAHDLRDAWRPASVAQSTAAFAQGLLGGAAAAVHEDGSGGVGGVGHVLTGYADLLRSVLNWDRPGTFPRHVFDTQVSWYAERIESVHDGLRVEPEWRDPFADPTVPTPFKVPLEVTPNLVAEVGDAYGRFADEIETGLDVSGLAGIGGPAEPALKPVFDRVTSALGARARRSVAEFRAVGRGLVAAAELHGTNDRELRRAFEAEADAFRELDRKAAAAVGGY